MGILLISCSFSEYSWHQYTLGDYIIIQIDDFLVLVDKQREIKSYKVQLLKQERSDGEETEVPVSLGVLMGQL